MNHRITGCVLILSLVPAAVPSVLAAGSEPAPAKPGIAAEVLDPRTDSGTLESFLKKVVGDYEGRDGKWTFKYDGVEMLLLADEEFDRVRIVAPIADASGLAKPELLKLLEANFERALDAKYAIFKGGVWSTYVHPMGSLSKEQLVSAVRQVARLRHTYGTTYSSMDVLYGGGAATP